MPTRVDHLEIPQGTTWGMEWPITNAAGFPTGWSARSQVRPSTTSAEVLHEWSTALGNAQLTAADSWGLVWAASTAYQTPGRIIRPTVGNGRVYRVVVPGASAAIEPTWPTSIGVTVIDGGVTWECAGIGVTALVVTPVESTAWTWRHGVFDLELTDPTSRIGRLTEGTVRVSPEVTR